jgi:hypothetical protein
MHIDRKHNSTPNPILPYPQIPSATFKQPFENYTAKRERSLMPIFVGKEKMKLNTLRNEVLSIKRICF